MFSLICVWKSDQVNNVRLVIWDAIAPIMTSRDCNEMANEVLLWQYRRHFLNIIEKVSSHFEPINQRSVSWLERPWNNIVQLSTTLHTQRHALRPLALRKYDAFMTSAYCREFQKNLNRTWWPPTQIIVSTNLLWSVFVEICNISSVSVDIIFQIFHCLVIWARGNGN